MLINSLLRPQENDEDLGPEAPYLSVIETLMYLANYTQYDIAFAVNLLSKIYFFNYKKKIIWSKTMVDHNKMFVHMW